MKVPGSCMTGVCHFVCEGQGCGVRHHGSRCLLGRGKVLRGRHVYNSYVCVWAYKYGVERGKKKIVDGDDGVEGNFVECCTYVVSVGRLVVGYLL